MVVWRWRGGETERRSGGGEWQWWWWACCCCCCCCICHCCFGCLYRGMPEQLGYDREIWPLAPWPGRNGGLTISTGRITCALWRDAADARDADTLENSGGHATTTTSTTTTTTTGEAQKMTFLHSRNTKHTHTHTLSLGRHTRRRRPHTHTHTYTRTHELSLNHTMLPLLTPMYKIFLYECACWRVCACVFRECEWEFA